jgi:FAD/FMN-containing dehydrogenase
MKGMRVHPGARVARAQPGLTWGEFDRETHAFGLATTGGAVSTTGIAGLTLGGGIGWLQRKHGLTCDNLLSADVVTADGRFVTASETEAPDLFWGLRGGGGNFGIVTSFEYRLHPVDQVVAGPVLHPFSTAKDLFRFHREFAAAAPDEAFVEFGLGPLPDGQPGAFLFLFHAGPPDVGEEVLRPAREFGSPLEDLVERVPYPAAQQAFDAEFPSGGLNFWKSSNLHELTDDVIDTLVSFYEHAPTGGSFVIVDQFGGAVAQVPGDATAFGHRDAAYDLVLVSMWTDPAESDRRIAWTRSLWNAMQPYSVESVYVNYLGEEGDERVQAAYGDDHYARLVELKRKYDSENVFRLNQNIKP